MTVVEFEKWRRWYMEIGKSELINDWFELPLEDSNAVRVSLGITPWANEAGITEADDV